jgi:hypothetical protein
LDGLIQASKAWKELLGKCETGLNDAELNQVVNQGSTLSSRYDLKASRTLAWIELEKRVNESSSEKVKLTSLNAMAKLLINQGFRPLHLEWPFRSTLNLFYEFFDSMAHGETEITSELRRAVAHAMAWKALLMIDVGSSSNAPRYQEAWDLLGNAHSAGFAGTDSLLVWKAKLIIDHHFIPRKEGEAELTYLQALEIAENLLRRIGSRYTGPSQSVEGLTQTLRRARNQVQAQDQTGNEVQEEVREENTPVGPRPVPQVDSERLSAAEVYHISFVNHRNMKELQQRLHQDLERKKAEESAMEVQYTLPDVDSDSMQIQNERNSVASTSSSTESQSNQKRKRRIITESDDEEEEELFLKVLE